MSNGHADTYSHGLAVPPPPGITGNAGRDMEAHRYALRIERARQALNMARLYRTTAPLMVGRPARRARNSARRYLAEAAMYRRAAQDSARWLASN